MIQDGTTSKDLQVVFQNPVYAKALVWCARFVVWDSDLVPFKRLTNGTSVRLTGVLASSPGPGQDNEFLAESVEVLGACDPEVLLTLTQKSSFTYPCC